MYKFSTRKEHDAFYAKQIERERLIARVNKLLPSGDRRSQVYRAVDLAAVSDFINFAARSMLDYCSAKFKGLDIAVAWFEHVESGKCDHPVFINEFPTAGWQSNSRLWVRCDLPLDEILFTIAHEAHHCWYGRGPGLKFPYKTHAEQWEAIADAFARGALIEIVENRRARDESFAIRGQAEALCPPRQRTTTRNKRPVL